MLIFIVSGMSQSGIEPKSTLLYALCSFSVDTRNPISIYTSVLVHSATSSSNTGSGPTIRIHLWLHTSFIEKRRAGLTRSMFLIKFSHSEKRGVVTNWSKGNTSVSVITFLLTKLH